jgi:hypothetical protein
MRNDLNVNLPAEQPRGRTSLDDGRGAESDCVRAMAEVERVLHELALFRRRSTPQRSSPANGAPKAPSLVPAPSPIGLDFVFHKDEMIELTEAGFRRMGQAHSAGIDTVIEVDRPAYCTSPPQCRFTCSHIVAARIYELRKKRSEIKRVTDCACCDSRGGSTVWLARWRRHSGLGKLVGRRRHRVELEIAGRIAGETQALGATQNSER